MQRINPTHFIEQYNTIDRYRRNVERIEDFTRVLPIDSMKRCLLQTTTMLTMRTVAIWKIAPKKN